MSKEEIESHLRLAMKGHQTGQAKSFSSRMQEERKKMDEQKAEETKESPVDPKAEGEHKEPDGDEVAAEVPLDNEGKPELDADGNPVPPVEEPKPLTEEELNQNPDDLVKPAEDIPPAVPTEGQAEKPEIDGGTAGESKEEKPEDAKVSAADGEPTEERVPEESPKKEEEKKKDGDSPADKA